MSDSSGKTYQDFKVWPGQAPIEHRADVDAADSAAPTENSDWLKNHGRWPTARVYVDISFTGGTDPTALLYAYVRNFDTTARLGLLIQTDPSGTSTGTPFLVQLVEGTWVFDVPVDGDDLFVMVADIDGGPTATNIDIYVSWRP